MQPPPKQNLHLFDYWVARKTSYAVLPTSANVCWSVEPWVYARAVAEQIAVLVFPFRELIIQADRVDAQLWQGMQFAGL